LVLFPLLVTAQQVDAPFRVFAEAGSFQTQGDELDNGFLYGLGLSWRPGAKIDYETAINWSEHDQDASTSGVSSFDVTRFRLGVTLPALDWLRAGAGLTYVELEETRELFSCPGACTDLAFTDSGTGFYLQVEARLNRHFSALVGYTSANMDNRLDAVRGTHLGLRASIRFGKR
jgi:hypothetical protein